MGIEDRQTGLHTVWALVALSTLAAGKLVQRSPSGRAALGAGGLFLGLILAHTVPDEHPITLDEAEFNRRKG